MSRGERRFPPPGELGNVLTHGTGAVLSFVALVALLTAHPLEKDALRWTSGLIFGVSLVVLYASSMLAHAFSAMKWRERFDRIDHAAIYCLIAGTYTPFLLVTIRDEGGMRLFIIVWAMAFVGVGLKLTFGHRWPRVSLASYLAMGWMVVFMLGPLSRNLSATVIAWLVAGGLFYTGGVWFFVSRRRHAHMTWHLFVLAGSTCHFFAAWGALA